MEAVIEYFFNPWRFQTFYLDLIPTYFKPQFPYLLHIGPRFIFRKTIVPKKIFWIFCFTLIIYMFSISHCMNKWHQKFLFNPLLSQHIAFDRLPLWPTSYVLDLQNMNNFQSKKKKISLSGFKYFKKEFQK